MAGSTWASLALAVLVACGDPSNADDVDAGIDVHPDAPPGCDRPNLDASWLRLLLIDSVGHIAQAPRYLPTERTAARTYLSSELSSMGWTPERQLYPNGENVFAKIPATMGSGKTIVVGAHFDTVSGSPGANDNASGVAVVLAVARYLKDTTCRTSPVIVVFFDQEELGLFGSRAHAMSLSTADVLAVHTIDQVAWDSDGDKYFELELPTPALETEWKAAATVVGVTAVTTTSSGTDHKSYRDRGFAAVGLTEEYVGGDTSPFRHTPNDTSESISPYIDYLVLAAKLTGHVILEEVSP